MNKQLKFIFLFLLLVGFGVRYSHAQTAFTSEEDLKKEALRLFEDEEFEDAFPLYSQLVSLYPKDANYSYRLGVCMLYAEENKEKAIPFLEYAVKNKDVEKEAFFYLAKAYHLNYRFDDAIAEYKVYLGIASAAKAEKLQVERQIEMCTNGKKLLRNLTDLLVLDKKEVGKAEFYRSYDISDIGGKLLAKPGEETFKTSLDKKKKEKSIIYLSSNNNLVFFSSYGDDESHGKDIYVIRKLPSGEWSKPQTLGYPVNTEYDEDFPFLHPNGKVLYFCSKGHNSMGGYDIFKTTLNEETNTWNKPVNMDFPINTPDDDILYVTNTDEKEAYFSSARSSKKGETAVYHINVERKPIDVAIIKGAVIKNRDDQSVEVKITVKDLADNTILGIYNSKAQNGGYLINLPNGGRFMYTVDAPGFATQSAVVVLPTQYEFRPLKQEISYEIGTDKLVINNLFDEVIDDANYLLALNYIKEKAKMEANITDNVPPVKDTAQTEDVAATKDNATKDNANTETKPLSNAEIVKIAYDDAKDVQAEANDLKEQADIALNLANQKSEEAQAKTDEANKLLAEANKIDDNLKKQAAMDVANDAAKEADQLNDETVAAFNIAKKLGLKSAAKDQEADLSMQYAKDLEAAVKSKNPDALKKLDEQEKKLEELSAQNGAAEPDNITAALKIDADNKKKEMDKAILASADLKQEIADNETIIGNLTTDADKAKNDQLKKGLIDQIEELKKENVDKSSELAQNNAKVDRLQKEFNGILNETELVNNVVVQAKTGTNEDAAANAAKVDKAKLEQQVNEIKKSEPLAVNAANKDNTVATNNTSKDNSTKDNSAAITDNATKDNTTKDNATSITDNATKDNAAKDNTTITNNTVKDNAVKDNTNTTTDNSVKDNATVDPVAKAAAEAVIKKNAAASENVNTDYTNQLIAANNTTNEADREKAKAEVLKNWSEAITKNLANEKKDFVSATDPTVKSSLAKQISDGEALAKEKQDLAEESTTKAEALKKQQETAAATTADNTSTTTTSNNTTTDNTTTDNTTASNETSTVNKRSMSAINADYTNQLADAEKNTNEIDREKTKAAVLQKWSDDITASVADQKKEFITTTDPEMKALLAKKINDAETAAKEKQTLADNSNAKVKSLQQSAVATNVINTTNVTTNNSTAVKENTTTDNSGVKDNSSTANNNAATDNSVKDNTTTTTTDNTVKDNTTAADNTAKDNTNSTDNTAVKDNTTAADNAATTDNTVKNNSTATDNTVKDNTIITTNNTVKETASGTTDNIKANNTAGNEVLSSKDQLSKALAAAENDNNPLGQENKKAEAYRNYMVSVGDELNKKTLEMNAEKNKDKKKTLKAEIAVMESDMSEKQKTLDATNDNIKKIETASATTGDNSTNNSTANNSTADTGTAAKNSGTLYTNASAIEQAAAYDKLNADADVLQTQADAAKADAALEPNLDERDKKFAAAADIEKQVTVKKVEALKTIGIANKLEFEPRANQLDQMDGVTKKNLADDISMGDMWNDESKIYFEKAQHYRTTADTIQSEEEKLVVLTYALDNENIALEKQRKSLTVYEKYTSIPAPTNVTATNAASTNAAATNAITTDNTTTSKAEIIANSSSTNNTADNSTTNNSATVKSSSTITLSASDHFERASAPVYSASKPIPVNEKLPDGLIFKVQIGAFRNPIPQDLFVGMSPITAETTPLGFTRYTAGVFTTFVTADKVKEEIRQLGYKDAFVVAFLNGKRVAITDQLTGATNNVVAANTTSENNTANNTTDNTANNSASNTTTTNNSSQTPVTNNVTANEIAPTNSITTVSGLFYTVQIGVFSQQVTSGKLHGIQPLYTEKAPNGNLRYNTGVYNNVARAVQAKNIVTGAGIADAFVTAYYQGKRISVPEAQELEKQGGGIFSTAPNMNQLPTVGGSSANQGVTETSPPVVIPVTTQPSNVTEKLNTITANDNKMPVDSGVVFKVQIGAFKDEVPLSIANKFLQIASKGIKNYKDDNGLTIYTLGNFRTYEEASNLKTEVANAGVTDAFIVAYTNGKKISVEEAKQLLNK